MDEIEIELIETALDIIEECEDKLKPIIKQMEAQNVDVEGANGLIYAIYDILKMIHECDSEAELYQKIKRRFE